MSLVHARRVLRGGRVKFEKRDGELIGERVIGIDIDARPSVKGVRRQFGGDGGDRERRSARRGNGIGGSAGVDTNVRGGRDTARQRVAARGRFRRANGAGDAETEISENNRYQNRR